MRYELEIHITWAFIINGVSVSKGMLYTINANVGRWLSANGEHNEQGKSFVLPFDVKQQYHFQQIHLVNAELWRFRIGQTTRANVLSYALE